MLISKDGQSFEYELIRKGIKNINLRIKPCGNITVSANFNVPQSAIDDFLLENFEKILSSKIKFESLLSHQYKFLDGEIISILGIDYTVNILKNKTNKIYLHGDYIYFAIPDDTYDFKLKLFKKFILEVSKIELLKLTKDAFELFDLDTFPCVKFRLMKSRWGSCIPSKNQINLNSHLILQPYNSALYVIIHELAHFYHQNHSKDFYSFVESKMPDFDEHKNALRMYF